MFVQHFGYVEKRLDKKAIVNFKTYDVTYWIINLFNINIAQYLNISISFFTLCPSRGLSKYIKTKVLTTCFYLV